MPWDKTPQERRRDDAVYGAEWRKQRLQVLRRDGSKCTQCGSTRELTVDHITPVSQGGTHQLANLRTLCGPCHRAKTAMEGRGWRASTPADPSAKPSTTW